MKPKTFMLIAGEASGDTLAAELVSALRVKVLENEFQSTSDAQPLHTPLAPRFFGAGGLKMAAAGVELAFDMTQHAAIGFPTLRKYLKLRRLFNQLLKLAIEQQPDAIIGVDYGGFNLRFGHAIKEYVRKHRTEFVPWNPKLVQFISPQVWASRPARAGLLEDDYDLLLSIFPFEKDWYATRAPRLRVEFVGHPIVERFRQFTVQKPQSAISSAAKRILLLPGSRVGELRRHLPIMLGALKLIREKQPDVRVKMVLPNESLTRLANSFGANFEIQIGDLPHALAESDIAISKTGTIAMECAFFGVPTVTLYQTSRVNWEIAKRIVTVKSATMPNLLAGDEVFPEFIQHAATQENISRAAIELLQNDSRRTEIKRKLAEIISSLGGPGASQRAAAAITRLLQ